MPCDIFMQTCKLMNRFFWLLKLPCSVTIQRSHSHMEIMKCRQKARTMLILPWILNEACRMWRAKLPSQGWGPWNCLNRLWVLVKLDISNSGMLNYRMQLKTHFSQWRRCRPCFLESGSALSIPCGLILCSKSLVQILLWAAPIFLFNVI
jgi:hypothetical protein